MTVAPDNQAVLDDASVILVCVRPGDAEGVLTPLRFRGDHRLVSVMAGVPSARLAAWAGSGVAVSRAIPLPPVSARRGLTPVFPVGSAAAEVFRPLGGVVELADEAAFEAFSAASATVAAHFTYLDAVAAWMADHGVARADADPFVAAVFAGLDYTLHGARLADLGREHTTPGGINALVDRRLRDAGLQDEVAAALDAVLARLTGTTR